MSRLPPDRLPILIPFALAGIGVFAWFDWARRERRLEKRTADRLQARR